MKFLCVDDDPFMLQFFVEAVMKLELPDCEVVTAVSGESALQILGQKTIDVMILDKKLPDISGIEVLRRCRRIQSGIEVLVVTGHASVETAVEAMKAGARDYIEKPVRLALLHEKLLNIIELLKRGREAEEYRYAKEAVEAGAQRDIVSLEDTIGCMRSCQEKVMGILDSDRSDREKVKLVRQEISSFKKRID